MTDAEREKRLAELETEREALLATRPKPPEDPKLSERPCVYCGTVHPTGSNQPIKCRCIICGQIDIVAGSGYDGPTQQTGPMCGRCMGGFGPAPLGEGAAYAEQAAGLRPTNPWEIS